MLNREDYRLRKILQTDLEQVLTWRNSARIRACMYTDNIITWEEHCSWYQKTLNNPDLINIICEFQGQPIGVVNATQIDRHNSKCLWGFYLGDFTAPKGSSYVMGLLFLDFLFNNLALRKICSEVLVSNIDSLKFHSNLGFQQEGVFKEHIFKQGVYTDVVAFGLLSEQWQHERDKTEARLFPSVVIQ